MKTLFLSLFPLLAFAAPLNPVGTFSFPHQIPYMAYDKKGCEEDKGTWDGSEEEGICIFDVEDSVAISEKDGLYTVGISTITTNAHSCSYSGTGAFTADSDRVLLVSAPSEEFIPGENGGDGKFVPAVCEVKVTFSDDDTVTAEPVSSYSKCSEFCGANAYLGVENARRK